MKIWNNIKQHIIKDEIDQNEDPDTDWFPYVEAHREVCNEFNDFKTDMVKLLNDNNIKLPRTLLEHTEILKLTAAKDLAILLSEDNDDLLITMTPRTKIIIKYRNDCDAVHAKYEKGDK